MRTNEVQGDMPVSGYIEEYKWEDEKLEHLRHKKNK